MYFKPTTKKKQKSNTN